MPTDPLVPLASSIHAGPGTFALLLGSGVSASSGVLTGWDVTLDLIKRLATIEEEDIGEDPIEWYRKRVDGEPDYSELLTALAPSPFERQNLLKGYFEPTDKEREEGLKLPTPAHKAIAQLLARGFIRVIVTTNFDRLLELALSEAGVQPNVIASPDAAEGPLPLVHSPATVIKVHGDYQSPDLKNTVDELSGYDPHIDRLLDQVFDQYGLIVCGWSGVWDKALRAALLRAPGRRFPTYWLHHGPLDPHADDLVNHRSAMRVEIKDADTVFTSLADKVEVLFQATDQRPADTAMAVAQLKKYLPDPVHWIRLHDLVMDEVEAVIQEVGDLPMDGDVDAAAYGQRMAQYERATATLVALLATGARFSDREAHDRLWAQCIERLATRQMIARGDMKLELRYMQQYPTLLALYALALGAFAADRLDSVALALGSVMVGRQGGEQPVGVAAASWHVLDEDMVRQAVDGFERRRAPISDHLLDVLKPAVSGVIPGEARLERPFDEVEYLLGLAYASFEDKGIGPIGRAAGRWWSNDKHPGDPLALQLEVLLSSGLFRSEEHFKQTRDAYDLWLSGARVYL